MKKLSILLFLFMISSHSIAGIGDLYNCKMTQNIFLDDNRVYNRELENFSFKLTKDIWDSSQLIVAFNPSNYLKRIDAWEKVQLLELFVEEYLANPNDSESDFEVFWANDGHAHDMLYTDRENENDGGGHFSYSKNNGDYVIAILARCEIF